MCIYILQFILLFVNIAISRWMSCLYGVDKSSLNFKILKCFWVTSFYYLLIISITDRIWFCVVYSLDASSLPFSKLRYCYFWSFLLGNLPPDTAILSEIVEVDVNNVSMYYLFIYWFTAGGKCLPTPDTILLPGN